MWATLVVVLLAAGALAVVVLAWFVGVVGYACILGPACVEGHYLRYPTPSAYDYGARARLERTARNHE
jgi:hypothetical protein